MREGIMKYSRLYAVALLTGSLLLGCTSEDSTSAGIPTPDIRMQLPDSLTGGVLATVSRTVRSSRNGLPCFYIGTGTDDPFRNGYQMTKLMVSAVATWTCVADAVIELAGYIPHDGEVHQSNDNVYNTPTYDPEEPTHYSVTDDSDSQVTVRLYYGYDVAVPPLATDMPGFYVSWNEDANGDISGRMVIDANYKDGIDVATTEDPVAMRVDFDFTAAQRYADMYLKFGDGNAFANGFHIEVTRNLTAVPTQQVYLARGMIDMKAQFWPDTSVAELPVLKMYTVSDQLGEGAAVAEFADIAVAFELNTTTLNHLGEYLFTNTDKYFFDADQTAADPWDYIHKEVTASEYRGLRTTPATGGTWLPFDPSLDMIINAFSLDADYFTNGKCENYGDSCNALINGIAESGFDGYEQNQGSDPMDWRSTAIASPVYLDSVYPLGYSDWSGVFDQVFIP